MPPPVTPAKYALESAQALVATKARTVCLVVLHGHAGHGFSVSATSLTPDVALLPSILRQIADQIEADS